MSGVLVAYAKVDHPMAQSLVKKVICVATSMAVLIVINAIVGFTVNPTFCPTINGTDTPTDICYSLNNSTFVTISRIVMVLLSLSIPLCGILGARNRNKPLVCFFCGCNCFLAVMSIVSIVVAVLALIFIQALVTDCRIGSGIPGNVPSQYGWLQCDTLIDGTGPEASPSSFVVAFNKMTYALVAISCISFVLQCMGFVWGLSLYNNFQTYFELPVASVGYTTVTAQPANAVGYYQPPTYSTAQTAVAQPAMATAVYADTQPVVQAVAKPTAYQQI